MPNWIEVARVDERAEQRGREVWVNGRPIALFKDGGRVFALEDRCPHREDQLSDGWVGNGEAICPLHRRNFDLATGISPYDPRDLVATYPVKVEDGWVFLDADAVDPLPRATFAS